MTEKFNRNYILIVQNQNKIPVTITPPFTIEFDITRTVLNSANVANIRVYNLSAQTRNSLAFNIFNQQDYRVFQLYAGYGNNLALIFSGNITECWSVREGTNWITQIQCYDGGFVYNNTTSNLTFPAGTPNVIVIAALVADLAPTVLPGVVTPILGETVRGKSYTGPTTQILGELTNGQFFIDLSTAYVLPQNSTLIGSLPLIDASAGIIGTPVLEQNIMTLDMIFEPRLKGGQYTVLNTISPQFVRENAPVYTGTYKLNSVKHRGMISAAVCGDCITTISMTTPALLPGT